MRQASWEDTDQYMKGDLSPVNIIPDPYTGWYESARLVQSLLFKAEIDKWYNVLSLQ